MKKALIVHRSRTGITERYGREIEKFLASRGIETRIVPIEKYPEIKEFEPDYLLLGCWTAGLMLLYQQPDKAWKNFAQNLTDAGNKKIALFTTYKLATGRMFKVMKKYLQGVQAFDMPELKSRNGSLSEGDKSLLVKFTE